MKYFTRDWLSGNISQQKINQVIKDYWSYIESLLPKLPASVKELAKEINFHDGIIHEAVIDKELKRLKLKNRCGDLQVGYFDLEIDYIDVNLQLLDIQLIESLVIGKRSEVLYDEVDIEEDNVFVHRMLLSPIEEVIVYFRNLEIKRVSKPNRSI
jgi:hypothetical protein